ncbi:MAG: hypothetical protein HQK96_01650 [Nitrospirae bacterium]|nr:hypothetical protein [Nitrospirota bacterium]
MIPILGKDENKVEDGMYLVLYHGFKKSDLSLTQGWGENGPMIGPLDYVDIVYGHDLKFKFSKAGGGKVYGFEDKDCLTATFGCICYNDIRYGYWKIINIRKGLPNEVSNTEVDKT